MNRFALFAATLAFGLGALSSASVAAEFGSDRHVARGVQCVVCHGPDEKNPAYPDEAVCTTCHNRDVIAEKTKALETNPHKAPHNGDCTLCHMQHEPEVNYCDQCHQFGFKMKQGAK